MWEIIINAVIQNITPLSLVAVMVVLNYRQNEQSNKTMIEIYQQSRSEIIGLSDDIKKLTSKIDKDSAEENRFDRVLSMYESAIVKITATQEKLANALDQLVRKQDKTDEKIEALRLDLYKSQFLKEVERNENID